MICQCRHTREAYGSRVWLSVVVPIPSVNGLVLHDGNLDVFTSTNGGRSWGADKVITTFHQHRLAGNLANVRLPFFPAEGVDRAGRIYLAGDSRPPGPQQPPGAPLRGGHGAALGRPGSPAMISPP